MCRDPESAVLSGAERVVERREDVNVPIAISEEGKNIELGLAQIYFNLQTTHSIMTI